MIAVPDLHVARVTPALAEAVRGLRVAADQYPFVGDVAFNLAEAEADPNSDAMAILVGEAVVGFYRLDYVSTIVSWNPLGRAGVGLRAFMLDRDWQGRGLGTRAVNACCADIERRHPERLLLALNVNCRNLGAIRAYRKAGFVDTGELYFGGRAGPQHLMVRALNRRAPEHAA
ncbi:GNAT family N-acetyltransferase [Luteimonas aquatica]|uniref:GNAT family N-acetyltransferase n=1 Tax=Luteimonas aquatica TaxID=450364 RepID=UPI001F591655|nr:GNAT family N-acetyltransferase [Luteimonas aquatica]